MCRRHGRYHLKAVKRTTDSPLSHMMKPLPQSYSGDSQLPNIALVQLSHLKTTDMSESGDRRKGWGWNAAQLICSRDGLVRLFWVVFFGGRPAASCELSTAEKTTIYLESVAPAHAPTSKSNKAPRRARWLALGAVGEETRPRRVSACMTIAINIDSAGDVSSVAS